MRTRQAAVMGTMPYMSPEQLSGGQLDHRTNIFSLGVMLYELASGERPFRALTSAALATAILRDSPRPLGERRRDLPEGFVRVVDRCMEKDSARRFASSRELLAALSGLTSSAPPESLQSESISIAVLP